MRDLSLLNRRRRIDRVGLIKYPRPLRRSLNTTDEKRRWYVREFDAGKAAAINCRRKFVRRKTIYTTERVETVDTARQRGLKKERTRRWMRKHRFHGATTDLWGSGAARRRAIKNSFRKLKPVSPGENVGTTDRVVEKFSSRWWHCSWLLLAKCERIDEEIRGTTG